MSSRGEVKSVSFKMPLETWTTVQEYAAAHGQDVSSVLNWLIAEGLPRIVGMEERRILADRMARINGMAEAITDRLRDIRFEEGVSKQVECVEGLLQTLREWQEVKR